LEGYVAVTNRELIIDATLNLSIQKDLLDAALDAVGSAVSKRVDGIVIELIEEARSLIDSALIRSVNDALNHETENAY
jgi:hypothetical protein